MMWDKTDLLNLYKRLGDAIVFVDKSECIRTDYADEYYVKSINTHNDIKRFFGHKNDIVSRFLKPLPLKKSDFSDDNHLTLLCYLLMIHIEVFSIIDRAQKDVELLHKIIDDLNLNIEENFVYKGKFVVQSASNIKREQIFFDLLMEDIYILANYRNAIQSLDEFSEIIKKIMNNQSSMINQIKRSKSSKSVKYLFDESINDEKNYAYIKSIISNFNQEDFFKLIEYTLNLFHFELNENSKRIIHEDIDLQSKRGVFLPNRQITDEQCREFFEVRKAMNEDNIVETIDFMSAVGIVPSYYQTEETKYKQKVAEIFLG